MRYNIYDKKYASKRINEIISLDYFKKFSNKEIYTGINSLSSERERLLLLPSFNEDEEKILIFTLKQIKHTMLSNRSKGKSLSEKVILKNTIDDKGIISSEELDSIEEIVNKHTELLYSSDKDRKYDLTILNRYIEYKGLTKRQLSEKLNMDIKLIRRLLNGQEATYYQLNKILKYFDCSSYDEFIKKINEICNINFSSLSKDYFSSYENNNISINICLMWDAIKSCDFDEDELSIANYLFSERVVSIHEASKIFNKSEDKITMIREKCLDSYKNYLQGQSIAETTQHVYKNVDS